MKKPKIILLAGLCATFAAGVDLNSTVPANDSRYVIEAKGEFGRELKNLVEKYAKDGNASVNIYQGGSATGLDDSRFLNIGVNRNQFFNITAGEQIYIKRCQSCHGEKGEKRASAHSKRLKDMSAEDIEAAINSYSNDGNYGGSQRDVMQTEAQRISYRDLGNVIAYLKGENAFLMNQENLGNGDISTKPTNQGTYLE